MYVAFGATDKLLYKLKFVMIMILVITLVLDGRAKLTNLRGGRQTIGQNQDQMSQDSCAYAADSLTLLVSC